jgi:hypothetical protein
MVRPGELLKVTDVARLVETRIRGRFDLRERFPNALEKRVGSPSLGASRVRFALARPRSTQSSY